MPPPQPRAGEGIGKRRRGASPTPARGGGAGSAPVAPAVPPKIPLAAKGSPADEGRPAKQVVKTGASFTACCCTVWKVITLTIAMALAILFLRANPSLLMSRSQFAAHTIADLMARRLGSKPTSALPDLATMTSLSLSFYQIGSADARALADAFPFMPALKKLDISLSPAIGTAIPYLAAALPSLKALDHLNLAGAGMKDAGAIALAAALPSGLKFLDLSSNYIRNAGFKAIVAKLPSLTLLTYLNLGDSHRFSEDDNNDVMLALAAALPSLPALERLELKFGGRRNRPVGAGYDAIRAAASATLSVRL